MPPSPRSASITKRGPSSSPASKIPDRPDRLPVERACEGVWPPEALLGGVLAAAAEAREDCRAAEGSVPPANVPRSGESMVRSSAPETRGTPQWRQRTAVAEFSRSQDGQFMAERSLWGHQKRDYPVLVPTATRRICAPDAPSTHLSEF